MKIRNVQSLDSPSKNDLDNFSFIRKEYSSCIKGKHVGEKRMKEKVMKSIPNNTNYKN